METSPTLFIVGISISSTLMVIIFSLFLFFYIKNKKASTKIKKLGQKTEQLVNKKVQLWASYKKNNAYYIPSTMFKYNSNKIFEVDGILITQRALIVFEVKNIRGNIEGNGVEKTWFKVLGKNRYEIKSPIFQNDGHLDHIVKMTGMKVPMVSVIVFDEESVNEIDVQHIPNHVVIIKTNQIESTLDTISSMLLPKITKNEVDALYSKLQDFRTNKNDDRKMLESFSKEYNDKTFTI